MSALSTVATVRAQAVYTGEARCRNGEDRSDGAGWASSGGVD